MAALAILLKKYALVIPITIFAAFNRETSGLIPFMLVMSGLFVKSHGVEFRKIIMISIISLGLYILIYFGLRAGFGEQSLVKGYGNDLGLDYFLYNLQSYRTYVQLFATLGILPIIAVLAISRCPHNLQAFFWAVVPIWMLVHPFLCIIAETRVFLVPLAVVFIPAALFAVQGWQRT
jgi:hypothetical protein